jgi:hypothetical protein
MAGKMVEECTSHAIAVGIQATLRKIALDGMVHSLPRLGVQMAGKKLNIFLH